MGETLLIRGKILSGAKEAAFFTQLDWVKEQCLDKLGLRMEGGLGVSYQAFELLDCR